MLPIWNMLFACAALQKDIWQGVILIFLTLVINTPIPVFLGRMNFGYRVIRAVGKIGSLPEGNKVSQTLRLTTGQEQTKDRNYGKPSANVIFFSIILVMCLIWKVMKNVNGQQK